MSIMIRRGTIQPYNIQNSSMPIERRNTIIAPNMINNYNSNLNGRNSITSINTLNSFNSLNYPKNDYNKELNDIFNQIKKESKNSNNSIDSYQSIKSLEKYIRKNRNNIEFNNIMSDIFNLPDDFNIETIIYIIELILNLITDNSQMINYLIMTANKLINFLTQKNLDLTYIDNISNTFGKLIKMGGIYIKNIIENTLDTILTEHQNYKYENTKYAHIQLLSVIIQNAPMEAFGRIKKDNLFFMILDNFNNAKFEIRNAIGELIGQVINMFAKRDNNMKNNYVVAIYEHIFTQFQKGILKNNDTQSNINLLSGLSIVLKNIYIYSPNFLKNGSMYINLANAISRFKNAKNDDIKIEFIKFLPQLYQINKEIFIEHYRQSFFEEFNKLDSKTRTDLRNGLLLTMGSFSIILRNNYFEPYLDPLLNVIKILLIEKKIYDKEIYKCLADLFKKYSKKVIEILDLNVILSKLFKTEISTYKIDLLISIMKVFTNTSDINLITTKTSLNIISLILWDETFNFSYSVNLNKNNKNQNMNEQIDQILKSTQKYMKKYFAKNVNNGNIQDSDSKISNKINTKDNIKDSIIFSKCKFLKEPKTIKGALILFSRIENDLFFKDMLVFYKEKILPFLFYINDNKIIKKILDIMLCRFVKIYDDDKNSSEYIIRSILDSLKNFIFTFKDNGIVLYAFNILHQKNIFIDLLLENKKIFFNKIIGLLSSNNVNDKIKEKIIQTIGILAKKSHDKNDFIILIKRNINNLLFTIQNNEDIILKENNVQLLLYYSLYVKFLFDFNLIEKIMEMNIDLLISNEYQSIISMNVLKIFCELLKTDIIINQFQINNNDKFNEYFQLLLIICIINIKEGRINTKNIEISLKTLYQLIKIKKIDIYQNFTPQFSQKMKNNLTNSSIFKEKNENDHSLNYIDELLKNEKGEKMNLVEILLQKVVKGATDECLTIIMNIFGLCGVMEPSKMEKFFSDHGLSIYHLEGNFQEDDSIDENEYKITLNNKHLFNKSIVPIDLSSIDPSTSKTILTLMRILKENIQQEVCLQIISCLSGILKALTIKEANIIDIILPTLIEIFPQYEMSYQKNMLDNMKIIIENFKDKIKFYLNDIIQLILDYIMNDNYLIIICEILNKLFTFFVDEMEIYYPLLIPVLLNAMKQKEKEGETQTIIIKIFVSIASNNNIASYLNIMIDELSTIYLEKWEDSIIDNLLKYYTKIVSHENTNIYYSTIINSLLNKIKIIADPKYYSADINKLNRDKKLEYILKENNKGKLNYKILNESINIFCNMNNSNRNDFIEYLPLIIDILKETNFLYYGDINTKIKSLIDYFDFEYMTSNINYLSKIEKQLCIINCSKGFYSPQMRKKERTEKKNEKKKKNFDDNLNDLINKEIKKNSINKYLSIQSNKNRKAQIDNEKIITILNNSKCQTEEEWNDWFKNSSKILFDQSPSYILFICNSLSEFYFPLILELYNYGFFTVYINNNDRNKDLINKILTNALFNQKTPNDILLTVFNLIEFIERRNVTYYNIDYNRFGQVAYKCRAFAKALYYKENGFLINSDYDKFKDLLELYYEVKQQENAKGLLELVNKNKDKNSENFLREGVNIFNNINLNENDKYILYIKIHDYDKALKIIDKQMLHEENKEKYETLKKNRIICLNGLCDWEKLISEGSDDNLDLYDEIKENTNIIVNNIVEKDIKKIIDEEILLSKACMNLSQWTQLKSHFYKIHTLFKDDNNEFYEQNIIDNNLNINIGKKSDINEDDKSDNDINTILKKNEQGRNTDSVENDINENIIITTNKNSFNKNNYDINKKNNFILRKTANVSKETNYKTNPMSLINQTNIINEPIINNSIINEPIINNININNNINDNNFLINEQLDFIPYDKIIDNNSRDFNFLDGNLELLFDINFYSSIISIYDEKYENALKFILSAKKTILSDIKPLLAESYTRGYKLLIKNQLLCLLEQIIEYKQFYNNNEKYLKQMVIFWDKGLEMIGQEDPSIYEKFLSLRSLILPIEKDYEKYIDLAKIYRKMGMYNQSRNILNRIQKKLGLNNVDLLKNNSKNTLLFDEIKVKVNLSLNQCYFEKGKIDEALEKSEHLVYLLNKEENKKNINNNQNVIILEEEEDEGLLLDEYGDLSKLDNKIKSKIYGNYAIYKQSKFDFKANKLKYWIKQKYLNNKQFNDIESDMDIIKRNTFALNIQYIKSINSSKYLKTINLKSEEDEVEENIEENLSIINANFLLATKYNNKSFKYWHNYAMFNYKFYTSVLKVKNALNLKEKKNNNDNVFSDLEIIYAINAVNGFKNSLCIGGKNKNKTFQDLLRLIDLFFSSASTNKELLNLINDCFNEIDEDAFLNVIPQLLCRFDINQNNVLSVLVSLLIKIGKAHPRSIILHLIVMKNSNSRKRISTANQILNAISKNNNMNKILIEESEMFVKELNNCAILLHEQWLEVIEETTKMYYNKEYNSAVKILIKFYRKMHKKPDNNYDIHFYQKYGSDIFESERHLNEYINKNYIESLNEAWDLYLRLYRNMTENFKQFKTLSLEYISSKLSNLRNSNISLPGSYEPLSLEGDNSGKNMFSSIRIKKMGKILKIFNTKQHPRQLSMIGTDDKEYLFLLKGHEDLRQDERAMQLFNLVNTILVNNKFTASKNLCIDTYSVFPLSHSTGIIGWVPDCDTLHQLIKEKRELSNMISNVEHRNMFKMCSKYETCNFLYKVEIFKESIREIPGMELSHIIWMKSKNCETWLIRRTNYSRSLAVMSMVGYILGLGDRHPSNLMMSRKTGKIIHIDFGDCFEIAMKRNKFPEKVSFRLTRMLVKALGISGVEGTFRIICEKVMELMRDNKDSLLAILGSFLYDPLISFRLMIPIIIKQKKFENVNVGLKNKKIKKKEIIHKNKSHVHMNDLSSSVKINNNNIINKILSNLNEKNENNENNEINDNNENYIGIHKKERKEEKVEINEEKEKNEKKKMEKDERQIFNIYEENDEIESEELNKIAQMVLERINNKLSGTDFYPDIVYGVKEQVEKLINEAVSYENLAQSYLGWCPFW